MEQYKLTIISWVKKYLELCVLLQSKKLKIFNAKHLNSPFSLLRSNSIGFIKKNVYLIFEKMLSNQFIYEFFREMNSKSLLIEEQSEIKMLTIMKQMFKEKGYINSQFFCLLLSEYSNPISKLIMINLIIILGFLYKDDPEKDNMQNYSFKDYIFYLIFYSKEKSVENTLLRQTLWLISVGLDVFTNESLITNNLSDNPVAIKENCSIQKKNSLLFQFLTSLQSNSGNVISTSFKKRIEEVTSIKDKLNNELNSFHEFRKDHNIAKIIISTLNNKIKKLGSNADIDKIEENNREDAKKYCTKIFDSKEKRFRLNEELDSSKNVSLTYEEALDEISKLKEINQNQARIIKDYEMKSDQSKKYSTKSAIEKVNNQDEEDDFLDINNTEPERRKSSLMDDLVDTYSQQNRLSLISNEQNDDFISEFSQVIIGLKKSKLLSLKNFSPFSVKNILNNHFEYVKNPSLETFNQVDISISSDQGLTEKDSQSLKRNNRENLRDFSNILDSKEIHKKKNYHLNRKNIAKSKKDKSLHKINAIQSSIKNEKDNFSLIRKLNRKEEVTHEFEESNFNVSEKSSVFISLSENKFVEKENIQNLYSNFHHNSALIQKNYNFFDKTNNKKQSKKDLLNKSSQNQKLDNIIENINSLQKNPIKYQNPKKSQNHSFISFFVLFPFICTVLVLFYECLKNFI